MPGKWKPDQQKTDCFQAHGSEMSSVSRLGAAVVPIHAFMWDYIGAGCFAASI